MEPTPEQTAFMAKNWRDLIRPRTLEIEERSDTYGKFSCEPLERGFGTTLGVALRRILLSSLQGAAITHIAIEGALSGLSTIPVRVICGSSSDRESGMPGRSRAVITAKSKRRAITSSH